MQRREIFMFRSNWLPTASFLIAMALMALAGCGRPERPAMAPLPSDQAGMQDSNATPSEAVRKGLTTEKGAAPADSIGLNDY